MGTDFELLRDLTFYMRSVCLHLHLHLEKLWHWKTKSPAPFTQPT